MHGKKCPGSPGLKDVEGHPLSRVDEAHDEERQGGDDVGG